MYNTQKKQNNATTKGGGRVFCPYLFCSSLIPSEIYSALSESFCLRLLPAFIKLDSPVASHPDMLIFRHKNQLIMHSEYYRANKDLFKDTGYDIILSDENIEKNYPNDVLFNALSLGNTLFARQKSISLHIKNLFEKTVNVKQGYTACSCCKVNDNAIITADRGIANVAIANGFSALLINPGHIILNGYEYGFIGGASFVSDDRVYFFGNLDTHPDADQIRNFILSCGKECISLSDSELTDLGGALII